MYKLTTYLKDLPLQSVSSKKNLQVVDHMKQTVVVSLSGTLLTYTFRSVYMTLSTLLILVYCPKYISILSKC